MSSSETRSRKRDAETIQVASQPEAKRTKRLRVSWACTECRRKKERCDGIQPICGSCKSQDRDCSYVRRPKKRGLTTGYVRGLEILLGLIFHSVEGCEHLIAAILKGESSIASPGGQEHQSASTVNVLVETWRNSSSWKELERILSTVESGEDEEFTTRDLHDRLDEALKESLSINEGTGTSTILSGKPSTDSRTVLVDCGGTPEFNGSPTGEGGGGMQATESAAVETLPSDTPRFSNLLQDWPELLDIYFASTNSWIPIILKNDAFRAAYTLAAEPHRGQTDQLPLGDQACLFSMLAYARYECVALGKNGSSKDLQDNFTNVFAHASHLISHYESQRDIGHIQAMLIFTILYYAQGNLKMAWSFVGKAVYHVVELGLLKSGIAHSSPLNPRSKRVVLSCFVLETLLSARLQRRPYMRTCDVQPVGLLDADGIEEWEPWRPASLLPSSTTCNLPRLSQQPARVLTTFNLLVQASTMINDKLQGHIGDADRGIQQRHLDILGLLQSQDHLNNLIAQSEAQEMSPQAANLMLATVACLPNLIPTSAHIEHTNLSCPSSPQTHRILASVAERAKQQRTLILPPFSDVYLNIIENRNKNCAFSHETHDPMTLVWELRARYNGTRGSIDFYRHHSPEATIQNHREPLTTPNSLSAVLGQGPSDEIGSRNQFMVADGGDTGKFANGDPSASFRLQPEGFTRSGQADDANRTPYGGHSRSPLLDSLDVTSSKDLFSSLLSLENDDRPVLSQEFVENLGVLGDIGIDSVEFHNLFTG